MTRIIEKNARRTSGSEQSRKRPNRQGPKHVLLLPPLILLFVGASLFYVWSRIQVIQLGYEISSSLKEEKAWTEANKRLRLEIATLKSYARIERVAAEELKMGQPKSDQVVVIR